MNLILKYYQGIRSFFRRKSFSNIFGSSGGSALSSGAKYKSYACINSRAENIAKAKIYLYEAKTKNEIPEHPFLSLIVKPNKQNQTFKEILHKISTSLDLYGNAYVYILRGVRKTPIGLYFLPSNMVTPVLNTQRTEILRYEYVINGNKSIYKPADIIHFTIPDPDNNLLGKATVSAFNFSLDIDYYQNLYQRNYYLNDAALGLIIESEKELDDPDVERLKSEIQNQYEGSGNVGRTLILQGGLKAKPYHNSPKDVEIIPARKMVREEIMTVFRVPKTILGLTDDVNRANARESLKTFNDYVIKPFASICLESKFNLFLKNNYPEDITLSMEYEFEIDRDLQLKAFDIYRKYDIVSKEEIREIEGFSKSKLNKSK
ncbi:MAG: phage portal protein [Ignavibacteriae bacterium]|nr:phage portal protein [Ignavibacteriota bacterium]